MQFFYMAYFFIEAEELDKLNWSKSFLRFFKCQTFRMREKFRIGKFKNYIFLFLLNEFGIVSYVIVNQQEVKISNSKN